jgi:hypothetical protein
VSKCTKIKKKKKNNKLFKHNNYYNYIIIETANFVPVFLSAFLPLFHTHTHSFLRVYNIRCLGEFTMMCRLLHGYSDDGALCSKANRHVQSLGCTSGDGGEYLKQWSKMQQPLCCCMENKTEKTHGKNKQTYSKRAMRDKTGNGVQI